MSEKVIITESSLADIAEAIRDKAETVTLYRPGDMAAAIQSIHTLTAELTGTTLYLTGNGASVTDTTAEVTNNG